MIIEDPLKYILDRHKSVLEGGEQPTFGYQKFHRYAVSIFRGGIGKTTLAFNLAYELALLTSLLVIDVCPQRNLSELLLGYDLQRDDPTIYDALISAITPGFSAPAYGTLGQTISQTCKDFRFGKPSFVIPGSNSLFLFASSLYSSLGSLSVMEPNRRTVASQAILSSLRTIITKEMEALKIEKCLIDTSPFFGGATHLAWMAAEALIIPVRVDKSSIQALELTLRMLSDPNMDFLRYSKTAELGNTVPKIQVIALTHCGWSRMKSFTPDQSTQAFVQQVIKQIQKYPQLFTATNPLDSVVLLDDFHSSGRISGATRTPLAKLRVGDFVTIPGEKKRLQVNESLGRYQGELKLLAKML